MISALQVSRRTVVAIALVPIGVGMIDCMTTLKFLIRLLKKSEILIPLLRPVTATVLSMRSLTMAATRLMRVLSLCRMCRLLVAFRVQFI